MLVAVNLLPPDRRAKEATPMGVLLPMLGGVALLSMTAAFWTWLRFSELAGAELEREEVASTLASKKPALDYLASLRSEQTDFETRTKTIKEIAASRVLWTKKLDEFLDVTVDDDDGRRYLVWLDDLEVKAAAAPVAKKENKGERFSFKGRCLAEGDALQRFNVFHASLKASPFFGADFEDINDPAGGVETLKDGRTPSSAWTMDVVMNMKARTPEAVKKVPQKPAPGRVAEGR